jgi:penicillin amidase
VTLPAAGTVTAALVFAGLVLLGSNPPHPLPPVGPLLDPIHGIWSAARQAELPPRASSRLAGLSAPVSVRYDRRGVPHITAGNELDAVRALGYVVARDRLFQLEVLWRSGAGRLTELVGPAALPLDQEARRLGLGDAAERYLSGLGSNDPERRLLEAFSDGVTAWQRGPGRAPVPFEYHLLGRRPAQWSPINSVYLLGRMGWNLAYSRHEERFRAASRLVGEAAARALFPVHAPLQQPIIPNGERGPRLRTTPLPPPGAADSGSFAWHSDPMPDAVGSNNWAVSPSRTAAGYALLAGDQHLELDLPSLWYEVALAVPDSLELYGVTLPGAPVVVIGFNRDLAWTFTNAEADVLDWYAERVDDPRAPGRYQLDGAWHPLRLRIEPYRDPDGRTLATDTLRFTHRGPLQRDSALGGWVSMRWTVLETRGTLLALDHAARARTAREFLARTADFAAPAQNMLVADRAGTIAIRATGWFPLRPGGRGDLAQPGERSSGDWQGRWPLERLESVQPAQGFLASANQEPLDPRVDSTYLGADWYSPWRAVRINQLLQADSSVTPDAMRRYQTDPGSPAADIFVPAFLAAARRFPNQPDLQAAAGLLAQWDRRYQRDNTRAVLYEAALERLQQLLWDELDSKWRPGPRPGLALVVALLRDPRSPWWDVRETARIEDRDQLLAQALVEGLDRVRQAHGPPDGPGWRWDHIRFANVRHLLQIPGLSALRVPITGGQSTLNPSSGDGGFGSSWRMVVELGPVVRAWGIYPGGQSGNPASSRYLDRLGGWADGTLDTLRFPEGPLPESETRSSLSLEPGP